MRRVVGWLAAALDAEVMVSDPQRGVLAAAPRTAPDRLAPLLARHASCPDAAPRPDGSVRAGASSDGTCVSPAARPAPQVLPLDSFAPGVVLALAARRPVGEAGGDLVRHAAKVLGLLDQAHLHGRLAEAERGVHLSALHLLMLGEEAAARRVLAGPAPGLLAPDQARVYVLDCAAGDREDAAGIVERTLSGKVLLARCPAYNHLIVVDPLHDGDPAGDTRGGEATSGSTGEVLRQLVETRPGHVLGVSRPRALGDVPEAYAEATEALAAARRTHSGVAYADERPDLVDVLPVDRARRWAGALLHPLLTLPAARSARLLRTLDLALTVQHKAAGRVLGVHRNTVAHRVGRCFDLLGLDRGSVRDRVLVSTALAVLRAHGHEPPAAPPVRHAEQFAAMLDAPEVRAWAAEFLAPLRADPRDLLRTLRAWLEHRTHIADTAAALDLASTTVRSHVYAAVLLIRWEPAPGRPGAASLGEDEQLLAVVRPLVLALYAAVDAPSPAGG